MNFNNKSNLLCLVGDFNARTDNLSDFIDSNDLDDYFVNNSIDLKELTGICKTLNISQAQVVLMFM